MFIEFALCSIFRLLKNSRSIANKPGILVGMLDILLNQVVKTLEFGEFELQIDPEFWPLLLKKCTGLER